MFLSDTECGECVDENVEIHEWRVEQLLRLGIPKPLADTVADAVDWHEVAALVRRGCSPLLAVKIVL